MWPMRRARKNLRWECGKTRSSTAPLTPTTTTSSCQPRAPSPRAAESGMGAHRMRNRYAADARACHAAPHSQARFRRVLRHGARTRGDRVYRGPAALPLRAARQRPFRQGRHARVHPVRASRRARPLIDPSSRPLPRVGRGRALAPSPLSLARAHPTRTRVRFADACVRRPPAPSAGRSFGAP